MTWLPWLYYFLLLLILIAGWLINILSLPGLWIMLFGHLLFAWVTGWNTYVGWTSVITLFILASAAEAIEFIAGAAGSKRAGGTRRGAAAAVIGGLVGGFVGSFLIPVLIAGTIIGAVAGSFLGAAGVERLIEPNSRRALRIGYGAAKGRLAGILIKSGIGLVMGVVSLVAAIPVRSARLSLIPPPTMQTAMPPATTLPASTSPVGQ